MRAHVSTEHRIVMRRTAGGAGMHGFMGQQVAREIPRGFAGFVRGISVQENRQQAVGVSLRGSLKQQKPFSLFLPRLYSCLQSVPGALSVVCFCPEPADAISGKELCRVDVPRSTAPTGT